MNTFCELQPYTASLVQAIQEAINSYQVLTKIRVSSISVEDLGWNLGVPCKSLVRLSLESQPKRTTIKDIPQTPECPACGFVRSQPKPSQSNEYRWELSWVPKCRACGDTGTLRDEHGQEACTCKSQPKTPVLSPSPDKCFEALVAHNNAAVQLAFQRLQRINDLEDQIRKFQSQLMRVCNAAGLAVTDL